jgi:branched-subunit amino acid transport protein
MKVWAAVAAVALISASLKGVGPALLGRRQLHPRLRRLVATLPTVVLAALVVSTVAGRRWGDVDAGALAGLAAATAAWSFKAPLLVAVACAVATSAALRLIG